MSAPDVSVVIATFNRAASVVRLLRLLAVQTIGVDRMEVIVVDDGSATPVAPLVAAETLPFRPQVVRQENGGPAAARDTGVRRARGTLVVVIDDDMIVADDFIAAHRARHEDGLPRVVLGRLRAPIGYRLQLFERMQLALLDRMFAEVAAGRQRPAGKDLYTGNVSFRRADYLAVGGFDRSLRLSEDAELGIRLERAGAVFELSDAACAWHASDHASLEGWMRRSVAYGAADAAIARKHGVTGSTDVWRYLFLVHPMSQPFLIASVVVPSVMTVLARVGMLFAILLGYMRLERMALAGATLAYGILYFRGIREDAGSLTACLRGVRRYLEASDQPPARRSVKYLGWIVSRWRE